MKKTLLAALLFILSPALSSSALAENGAPSYLLKYQMHQLFDNFNAAQESIYLRKYAIADIYLRYMLEGLDEVKGQAPGVKRDGTPLDRELFKKTLSGLSSKTAELREAIAQGDVKGIKRLPQEMMNACAACHQEMRLDYLFRHPGHRTVFSEEMHMVSKHVDLARIYHEEGGDGARIEENMKLVEYYLGLLKDTFPEAGPTGVVMDKENFRARLDEITGLTKDMLRRLKDKKPIDMESYRRSVNNLCVACHEPERLR